MPDLFIVPVLIPGSISMSQRVEGASLDLTQRVGRNVIFGVQRIKPPGGFDPNEYILQESGFNILLEDESGSILKES
jgi:hypothetical protein